ncbi:ubiquinol oxidase subunit II [Cereibacter sp. SYSU M97828]|nr:ubiquinol oxidase subunit II [Cereibacter flavus]
MKSLRFAAIASLLFLASCKAVVLSPSGDIAAQQRDLLLLSTGLMLLIIVPVMALVVFFAWKYRASNRDAEYDPDWHHSTRLELVIWSAPLLIIICLGALTWVGTHLLDPYRKLDRISADKAIEAEYTPLRVQVVSMDWKWLFIYPEYGFATVNELAAPVDRPIEFSLTSTSVMNAFYIPAMAGMIYSMPAMETKLNGVFNNEGVYDGFSSHYSGHGFSGMRFKAHALDQAGFDQWVADVRASDTALDRAEYLELEKPSEHVPPTRFGTVDADLYHAILNFCVESGKMCMDEMMALDRQGGMGIAGIMNVTALTHDKYARRGTVLGSAPVTVDAFCTVLDSQRMYGSLETEVVQPKPATPIRGHALAQPAMSLTPTFTLLSTPRGAEAL